MDANDVADQIREAIEEGQEEQKEAERFRSRAALVLAFMAVLMALAGLGGDNASEDMVNSNIKASDTWAFYQAKNVRQTVNKIAADEMEAQLLLHGNTLSPQARADLERKVDKYNATVERYESEPDSKEPENPLKGEGKKQLMAQAQDWEKQREQASDKDANFDYSSVALQVAVVLGSVAILAVSKPVLILSLIMAAAGTVLMVNGFLLLFPLP